MLLLHVLQSRALRLKVLKSHARVRTCMKADLQTSPNKIYDAVTVEFTAAGQDFTNKQGLRAQIMIVPFKVVVYLATVYFPGDD